MIIICENCNKKFDINDNLIPDDGRLVKCSNCQNTWFYKKNDNLNINPYNLDSETSDQDNEIINKNVSSSDAEGIFADNDNHEETSPSKNIKFNDSSIGNDLEDKSLDKKKLKKDALKVYFNYASILIISFIAIILIIDTFKVPISKYLPSIIPLLDNLYASLVDLILFIKDLFN